MKISTCIASLSLLALPIVYAAAADELSISEKGPHHRVWSKTIQEQLQNGKTVTRVKPAYTELATGMHYWSDEQKDWVESSGEIEVINGFGVARHGQHQVIWAANANTGGAVDLQSPDGKRFLSHVLGIAFTDRKTGASIFLATTKDSIGEVVGSQVIYKDAFDGVSADIVYTYSPAKFEQNIIFREALPDPSGAPWNMNADTVMIEVYTEFLDVPEPMVNAVVLKSESDPLIAKTMVEPDILDEQLDFGAMQIGPGLGFMSDQADGGVPVSKSFEIRDQRRMLIEKVEYRAAKEQMVALAKPAPLTKQQVAAIERGIKRDRNGVAHASLPKRPGLAARQEKRPIRTAQLSVPGRGFVMDYSQVNSATNVTLQGDTTYYVSGTVTLSGTTILEGGCVIKYAPTNTATIKIAGPLTCLTGPYKWATFTARDDHTIGNPIGTNALSGYYANYCLDFDGFTWGAFSLQYLRMRYANTGIDFFGGKGHVFSHIQLVNCNNGYNLYGADTTFRNMLGASLNKAITAIGYASCTSRWEHVTLDQVQNLLNTNFAATCYLTNCLLVALTNSASYSGSSNSTASSSSTVFQAVGAGLHYLATNSPYRDAGTTNINSTLLTQLQKKTTYPPVIRTNAVILDTTWPRQAMRDMDVPDQGYHYDSLDYVCDVVVITNATLTLAPGVTIGGYGSNPLWIQDGGTLISEGTPNNHNVICRYNSVQELSTNWGAAPSYLLTSQHPTSNQPKARFRFTDLCTPSSAGSLLYSFYDWDYASLSFQDCELSIAPLYVGWSSNTVSAFTNNLFFRNTVDVEGWGQRSFYNNLFYRGIVSCDNSGVTTNWFLRDNSFDGCTISDTDNTTNSYNAYVNTSGYLYRGPTNGGDLVLTNFNYATGPLGYFYQFNTNLVDKGSMTNAGLRGLYHYTTQTNQVKEANSKLDIGYHYVAGNFVTGIPTDTDGDGIPDYFEDTNGNGVFDAGETDWNSYNSPNGISSGAGLKVYTPLK